MISIRRHMAESPDQLTTALVRIPYALLEALANYSVKYDPVEFEKNRTALRKLRGDLEGVRNSTEALQATGAIVRTIEAYNRGVVTFMDQQAQEMNSVVTMCMGKLQELADGNGASAENLRRIGQTLEKANRSGDVRELKKELAESLQGVQREAAHQQEQSASIRTQARELIGKMAVPAAPRRTPTHQPACLAPAALKRPCSRPSKRIFTPLACCSRSVWEPLPVASARNGGKRLSPSVTRQIVSNLGTGDLLFRWKGPVLVALLERPPEERAVPPEVQRMTALHPEIVMEADGKTVKIPLKISSISFHLWEYETLDAVRRILDQCQQTIAPGAV